MKKHFGRSRFLVAFLAFGSECKHLFITKRENQISKFLFQLLLFCGFWALFFGFIKFLFDFLFIYIAINLQYITFTRRLEIKKLQKLVMVVAALTLVATTQTSPTDEPIDKDCLKLLSKEA